MLHKPSKSLFYLGLLAITLFAFLFFFEEIRQIYVYYTFHISFLFTESLSQLKQYYPNFYIPIFITTRLVKFGLLVLFLILIYKKRNSIELFIKQLIPSKEFLSKSPVKILYLLLIASICFIAFGLSSLIFTRIGNATKKIQTLINGIWDIIRANFSYPSLITTWIVLSALLFFFLAFVYLILSKSFKQIDKKNLALLFSTLFLSIVLIEGALRLSNSTRTYLENRLGEYSFVNHGSFVDSLYIHNKNDTINLGSNKLEFSYPRVTNSLGLSDIEWELEKPVDTKRVICLGDSFTEGDGAPSDSTWPAFLQQFLDTHSIRAQVMNAGICGSDPYYEINLLNTQLLKFKPDIVLFSLSRQDFLEDISARGGLERFDPATGKKTSLREYIFAYSHISRLIYYRLGYSWLLVKENKTLLKDLKEDKIPEVVGELNQIKINHPEIEIFVFLYPQKYNFEHVENRNLEDLITLEMRKSIHFNYFDLLPYYHLNIREDQLSWQDYYWNQDGHHNGLGYHLKARCIRDILVPYLLEKQ